MGPSGPTNPVGDPTHCPLESITVPEPTETEFGVMSPVAFVALLARRAYPELPRVIRGTISESEPSAIPR